MKILHSDIHKFIKWVLNKEELPLQDGVLGDIEISKWEYKNAISLPFQDYCFNLNCI